jgi:hypothetical protein
MNASFEIESPFTEFHGGNTVLIKNEDALARMDNLEVQVKEIESELLLKDGYHTEYHHNMIRYFYRLLDEVNEQFAKLEYLDSYSADKVMNTIHGKLNLLEDTINRFEEYQFHKFTGDSEGNIIDFNLIRFSGYRH